MTSAVSKFRNALLSTEPQSSLAHLQRLASKVGDVRIVDPKSRETSLHLACKSGRLEVVEWLLIDENCDSEIISRDSTGNTVLHIAADLGWLEIIELYLSQFPFTVDWVQNAGSTPLHLAAAKSDRLEIMSILLDYGADIDAADGKGDTPLHYASSWGKLESAKLLIESGCDATAKNNDGFTAAEYGYSFAVMQKINEYNRIHHENLKKARKKASRKDNNFNLPSSSTGTSNAGLGLVGFNSNSPNSSQSAFSPSNSLTEINSFETNSIRQSKNVFTGGTIASLSPFSLFKSKTGKSNSASNSPTTPNFDSAGSTSRERSRSGSGSGSGSSSIMIPSLNSPNITIALEEEGDGESRRSDSFNSAKPTSLLAMAQVNSTSSTNNTTARTRSATTSTINTTSTGPSLSIPETSPSFYNYNPPKDQVINRARSTSNLSITSSADHNQSGPVPTPFKPLPPIESPSLNQEALEFPLLPEPTRKLSIDTSLKFQSYNERSSSLSTGSTGNEIDNLKVENDSRLRRSLDLSRPNSPYDLIIPANMNLMVEPLEREKRGRLNSLFKFKTKKKD